MRRRAEDGFALLIVLWTLVLLTLLVSGLTASGRGEVKLAENLRDAAVAEAAADGAAQEAIFRLAAGQWAPTAVLHDMRFGNAVVTVRVQDEADLINPNNASVALLAALLRQVGAAAPVAQILATEIAQYHSRGGADSSAYIAAGLPYGPAMRDFRDVNELRLIPGMTDDLLARLAPHLSVLNPTRVVPDAIDPVVAAAFQNAGPNGGFEVATPPRSPPLRRPNTQLFVRVTATAVAGGARFNRVAEVQVFGQSDSTQRPPPYRIRAWGSPPD
ncbi:type II secretion system protein GspK [Acidisphaera sp. S103]|uniref:type II secretion system protein GspK n=1 Tax=Acidisphaera sp. S103 TaxID=1747223 RepID=UPI00131AEF08|nr:type II secretion system protein GspK [Acidisphaera sp. S103]